MHPNPAFRAEDRARHVEFARSRGFGVLALSVDGPPLISHVPFLLSEDGAVAELHLVRSNPIVRALANPQEARIAVQGPDGYVSPDWYGVADQVPTWNYAAVHLTGRLELQPQDRLRDLLDRQSAFFEQRLQPKPPWRADKMDPAALERMMRMIVPCRMQITQIDSTWKLNQNKPEAARLAAAENVEQSGIGTELGQLAALMRDS
ncbi:FMN-binding negative transcriptional regulator [Ruegeria arenilitoris]|uniref:FMN-binding negative transcriptional regulator n=1 Tax=Ruegeria arenilitoris TaxID=1173585 RepID=UPI0014810687|nr:FMN-binding negative transcriptional regulator [Ruegeria arenilitoris]